MTTTQEISIVYKTDAIDDVLEGALVTALQGTGFHVAEETHNSLSRGRVLIFRRVEPKHLPLSPPVVPMVVQPQKGTYIFAKTADQGIVIGYGKGEIIMEPKFEIFRDRTGHYYAGDIFWVDGRPVGIVPFNQEVNHGELVIQVRGGVYVRP